MKSKILKISRITGHQWVNLFRVQYADTKEKVCNWIFASRKKNPFDDDSIDAVVIIATIDTPEGRKVVITKEYRPPIRDYEYGFPAGLIDPGMTEEETVKKELKEETGLGLVKIISKSNRVYSSAGLTDESAVIYFVEAEGELTTKHRDSSEDIEAFLYSVDDIRNLLASDKKVGAKAWGVFYYYSTIGKI